MKHLPAEKGPFGCSLRLPGMQKWSLMNGGNLCSQGMAKKALTQKGDGSEGCADKSSGASHPAPPAGSGLSLGACVGTAALSETRAQELE